MLKQHDKHCKVPPSNVTVNFSNVFDARFWAKPPNLKTANISGYRYVLSSLLCPSSCATIACCGTCDYTLGQVHTLSPPVHKQLQATESQVGQGTRLAMYTVERNRRAIPTLTASTNFWRLFPLLCTEWPVVSMEIALSHWSSKVGQVEGVRPAMAKKSKMKLGWRGEVEEKRWQ